MTIITYNQHSVQLFLFQRTLRSSSAPIRPILLEAVIAETFNISESKNLCHKLYLVWFLLGSWSPPCSGGRDGLIVETRELPTRSCG